MLNYHAIPHRSCCDIYAAPFLHIAGTVGKAKMFYSFFKLRVWRTAILSAPDFWLATCSFVNDLEVTAHAYLVLHNMYDTVHTH